MVKADLDQPVNSEGMIDASLATGAFLGPFTSTRYMTNQVLRLQTTLPGDWIEALVGAFKLNLLQAGAACVEHERIHSMYSWGGSVQSQHEWRVSATLSSKALEGVLESLHAHHPYDVPQILTWSVEANLGYSDWVESSASENPEGK